MRIWPSKTLLSAALLLVAGFPLAAQDKPAIKAAPAPAGKAPAKAAPARTKGKLKPVDINSATKNEIAFMLAIPEDLAAKIVAGRPYPTKARLLTNKIVTPEIYAAIKDKVIARQSAPVR